MESKKYNALLSSIKKFFNVNDNLKNELNNIALNEHGKSLEELFIVWAKNNSSLPENEYNELINYMNELNESPDCISDMEIMYSFIYDF